jgi:hypothetical protein
MRLLPASPRTRRRIAWLAAPPLVAVGFGAALSLVPSTADRHDRPPANAAPAMLPPREVPLSARDRRGIDAALDVFVSAGVARRNLARAWDVVTPAVRAGKTRADWAAGDVPVYPYPARSGTFHGWTLNESTRAHASVDLLVHPRPAVERRVGPIAFTVRLQRVRGRWLVDSFIPTAIFSPVGARTSTIVSHPDFTPQQVDARGNGLNRAWLVVPLGLLALGALVPVALLVLRSRRDRRAMRRYASSATRQNAR